MFYWVIRAICYLPVRILYPTKVIGKKNLVKTKSILTANHRSNMDAVIIGVCVPKKISFLGKAELFKNKPFAWFFKKMQVIKVQRGAPDIAAVKEVLTRLKQDKTLGIFPGGTRQKEGQAEEFKLGVVSFAKKANAPIIPMVLLKRARVFRLNKLIIGSAFYLPPQPEHLSAKEHLNECINLLKQKQDQLTKQYTKEK